MAAVLRSLEGAPQAPVFSGEGSSGEGNPPGYIPISLGYQAKASMALLEMQANYVELSQLQREATILSLLDQQGKNGTIMTIANAIQSSASADADKDMLEMGSEITQVGTQMMTAGSTKMSSDETTKMNNAQSDLNETKSFETQFNSAGAANPMMGDGQLSPLSPEGQARYNEIVGGGSVKLNGGEEEQSVLQHIKANPADANKVSTRIHEAQQDANTRMNEAQTGRQSRMQRWQAGIGMLQHGVSVGLDAQKANIDANKKGPADAVRTIAQAADQNVSQTASQAMDQAKASSDAAAALNQEREAIARNSATPA
jgi:hypothetical protein